MKAVTSLLLLFALAAPVAAADAVLYCFTADWCVYCHQMQPVIGRMQQAGYPIQVINRDQQPQMAQQMGVRGLPYFVLVSNNQVVDSVEGATSFDRLTKMFRAAKPQMNAAQAAPQLNAATGLARGQSPQPSMAMPGQSSVQPAVYGQPMAQTPSRTGGDIHAQAMQASVKLKVSDPDGHSYGSGTVVHTQGNEALVLTCAHLFRDSQGQGPLEVITFQQSESGTTVPGEILVYDLERDVALVAIRTQSPIKPMSIAPPSNQMQVGQPAFSVGCDNGGPRNLYQTRINSVNRYVGHDNVQAAGAPSVGRSGGGLFNPQGQLVGVCNAADDEDDEGIYAAIPTIYTVLKQANLAHLFQNKQSAAPVQLASASQPSMTSPTRSIPETPQSNFPSNPAARSMPSVSATSASLPANIDSMQGLSDIEREMLHYLRGQKDGAEVTVVLRSKDNPTAQPAVFTLPGSPSPEFMRQASQNTGRPSPVMRGQSR
ncbi:trypsin-like peptidase domain-containing protein [Bremerella sp. P1]|uniref:trypsin-like peptidase domain-containing protein n=1 Tax=Bremerella sp. P1 TaxID=3026424 RepID=UPI00236743AA|nr:trypsin-like peptidase domain-containing protein [Bremerella sp. P1]WDI44714.1 trypsin-like peptidase domain-containing protein [Bremerella sp. P1]